MDNSSNNNQESRLQSQNYKSSLTKNFWCHLCKIEFSKIIIIGVEILCRNCNKNFCEDITNVENEDEHPSNFETFENPSRESQNSITSRSDTSDISSNSGSTEIYRILSPYRARARSNILNLISSLLQNEENNMENILNYLMQNDLNRYGNPPAGKTTIENLEKIEVDEIFLQNNQLSQECESSCSVCKDEFEKLQNLLKLPCKHLFHDECILPWLKERNSCPTCRYELQTDDDEYEIKKKTQPGNINNTNNSDILENI